MKCRILPSRDCARCYDECARTGRSVAGIPLPAEAPTTLACPPWEQVPVEPVPHDGTPWAWRASDDWIAKHGETSLAPMPRWP